MYENIDLPERAVEVLLTIDEYPHPTTTTIRESRHWADKNQHIHYRLDQLAEHGLIETWKDDDAGGRGALAPRRAKLTDEGERFVEMIDEDERPDSVEERLELMEKKVGRMQEVYGTVKERIVELEEAIEEHDENLDDIAEQVENVKRFVAKNVDRDE